MRALALQSNEAVTPLKKRTAEVTPVPVSPLFPQSASVNPNVIQRKAGCACGGGCPNCAEEEQAIQTKLQVSTPGDQYEQEADQLADQVMRMPAPRWTPLTNTSGSPGIVRRKCSQCANEEEVIQKKGSRSNTVSTSVPGSAPSVVRKTLSAAGQPLDTATRAFMEPRFGHDFTHVRIHTGAEAAASARRIGALAYTSGHDIVFDDRNFAPESMIGRQLLAHELAHVLQQSDGSNHRRLARAPQGLIQRAPTISLVDENFIGPLSQSQRRPARSCKIDCCDRELGTLHAMPLFHSASRTAIVPAGSPLATGIGASLHFIRSAIALGPADVCRCDDLRMIQIVTSNDPEDPRGNNSFVDNANTGTSPFYGSVGLTGRGEHTIDPRFVDSGERIRTSESIYDIPFRTDAMLAASGLATDFSWMAETCVACIKNLGPDRLLGCVTYGFTRAFDAATNTFGPLVDVSPQCTGRASGNFVSTLTTDPTTTTYDFEEAPDPIECGEPGDYNLPTGDTRVA